MPGADTRGRIFPSLGSKFGSVSSLRPPISMSSVAWPMYVTRIAWALSALLDGGWSLDHGSLRLCAFASEQPLLGNRNQVLYRVIQIQAGSEVQEDHRKHHRHHVAHHLRLRVRRSGPH